MSAIDSYSISILILIPTIQNGYLEYQWPTDRIGVGIQISALYFIKIIYL